MGSCQSLYYEDEDDKIMRIKNKQYAREMKEFQRQMRQQRQVFSEMDLTGRPRQKKNIKINLSAIDRARIDSVIQDGV